jgi:hypothetical protein
MISLFSAIVVTRLFLELILSQTWAHSPRLFGMSITPSQIGGTGTGVRRPAAGSRAAGA